MKKILWLLAFILSCASYARAQGAVQHLNIGANILVSNRAIGTNGITFMLDFPPNTSNVTFVLSGRGSTLNVSTSFGESTLNWFDPVYLGNTINNPIACAFNPFTPATVNYTSNLVPMALTALNVRSVSCPASPGMEMLATFIPSTNAAIDVFAIVTSAPLPLGSTPIVNGALNFNATTIIPLRADSNGNLAIVASSSIATLNVNDVGVMGGLIDGATGSAKILAIRTLTQSGHYTGTTATVETNASSRWLHTVTINTGAAATLTVFDLASGSCTGTPATNQKAIITLTAAMAPVTLHYDTAFSNGICVQASAAGVDATISTD